MGEPRRRACIAWAQNGMCRFGSNCRFSHDAELAYTPPSMLHRQWSHSQASTSGQDAAGGGMLELTVMSYNVLADELAHAHARELYRAVPDGCLDWRGRCAKLLHELLHWRPDVACLQEVDRPDDFTVPLHAEGYDASYVSRTGGRSDGCLTLWRRERWEAVAWDHVQMARHGLKDNVGLITVLRARRPPGHAGGGERPPAIAVANTHLLFNPRRGDIKLGQAGLILRRTAELCASLGVQPLAIFGGDFNSTPGSGVYGFIRSGELDCAGEDRRNLSGQLASGEGGWPPPLQAAQQAAAAAAEAASQPVGERRKARAADDNPRGPKAGAALQLTPEGPRLAHVQSDATIEYAAAQAQPPSPAAGLPHCSSFPRAASALAGQRRGGPSPLGAAAPRELFAYSDQFGQVAWSHIPPQEAAIARQPFFHEPMRCEEGRPPPPPPPPAGIPRTASFAQRQANAGTWSLEQLLLATGRPGAAVAGPRAKPPPPGPPVQPNGGGAWAARHPLPMRSSYEAVLGCEPAFTSCHGKFIGTVDYLWFTPQAGELRLQPRSVLLPPPLESLHCGLPSPEWPSDHVSLLVRFELSRAPAAGANGA